MRLFVLFSAALWSSVAFGWADAGHKIVASIAYRQMSPEDRSAIARILEQHPRFAEDFLAKMPDDVRTGEAAARDEWIFQQAAIWPDIARGFTGETKSKFNHPTWHYINVPIFLSDADRQALESQLTVNVSLTPPDKQEEEMNVIQLIGYGRRFVTQPDIAVADKAVSVCWLMHTIGDLHQPCHSATMFSRALFPDGDRGANRIITHQHGNMHALWDLFPGKDKTLKEARHEALELTADEEMSAKGKAALEKMEIKDWLDESRQLAAVAVYDQEVLAHLRAMEMRPEHDNLPPLVLSEAYLKTGGGIAKVRMVEAGFRLGAVLKTAAPQK